MADLKQVKDFIVKWNEENTQEFYDTEHFIWEHPELSMQEYESSGALMDLLEKHDFSVDKGVAGMPTAFIATYGEGRPVIGINCEYDALPGLSQDKDALEKKPIIEGAPGQGCGHNLIGTAACKAGIAIANAMKEYDLKGTVKIIGAPAEELCLGKPYLGKAGCLSGFDAILDWHPWSYTKTNYDSCQSYFSVRYHFKGQTCHGNSPWNGRSAFDAAQLQAHGVDMMRQRIYPGNPPDAANTINYTFTTCGPEFPSVVPDYTTAWYIGRFATTDEMLGALERVDKCAEGAALMSGTEVEKELITATHHKIPNKTIAQLFYDNMEEVGVPEFTDEEQAKAKKIQEAIGVPQTGLPTEHDPFEGGFTVLCDTPEYSWNAPYASPWIGMGVEGCGWHHWGVTRCAGDTMGEKSMDCAAKVISMTAMDLICDPAKMAEATKEWEERMEGRTYECLLPAEMEPPIHMNEDVMAKYKK